MKISKNQKFTCNFLGGWIVTLNLNKNLGNYSEILNLGYVPYKREHIFCSIIGGVPEIVALNHSESDRM
ncbi:hypothetical protein MSIBF_A4070001 [groundwater metagenome]|uniref:Uncharacterized protein n=1 Tax=groundwater metagenome TaxID=717931 RepID=A0A098EDA9_9ZZZZ